MEQIGLPKVSILIPTYNQENFVEKAITSALQQDYENLEVIVGDDCSANDLNMIIGQYSGNPKLKYYRNETNIGRVNNYRKCLYEYATGDWALCLDGDDYLTDAKYISECVQTVKNYADKNKNIVFIQAGDQLLNPAKKLIRNRLPEINKYILCMKGTSYFLHFLKFKHFSHLGTFYNRKKAIESGFYSNDILSTDIESCVRLSLHGDVILLKKVVGVWLHHGSNASQLTDIDLQLDNLQWIARCREYAAKIHPELQNVLPAWYQRTMHIFLISIVDFIMRAPDSGSLSLQKNKRLLRYIGKNTPSLFAHPKFIVHLFFEWIVLIKKYVANSRSFAKGQNV